MRQVEEQSSQQVQVPSSSQSTVSTSASAYRTPSTVNQISAGHAIALSTPPGCHQAQVFDLTEAYSELENFALEEPFVLMIGPPLTPSVGSPSSRWTLRMTTGTGRCAATSVT